MKVCRRSRQTFMFFFCLLCIIFVFLSSVALPDISVDFNAIAFKFGLSIVLDETNRSF